MILTLQVIFSLLALLGIGIILLTKNVIHAAYALALVLISLAGTYVLLKAELVAVVQILLYAGGVVILLVFGVMMTTRQGKNLLLSESKNRVLATLISITIFATISYIGFNTGILKPDPVATVDQVESIGISFLTTHLVAFELVAFLLLVALVGAAYLAKRSANE